MLGSPGADDGYGDMLRREFVVADKVHLGWWGGVASNITTLGLWTFEESRLKFRPVSY